MNLDRLLFGSSASEISERAKLAVVSASCFVLLLFGLFLMAAYKSIFAIIIFLIINLMCIPCIGYIERLMKILLLKEYLGKLPLHPWVNMEAIIAAADDLKLQKGYAFSFPYIFTSKKNPYADIGKLGHAIIDKYILEKTQPMDTKLTTALVFYHRKLKSTQS